MLWQGEEPRLWNCPPSSCHGVLYPRFYRLVVTFSWKNSPLLRGTKGVVLLSPRVWKGCHRLGTRDWYLMHYSNPFVTVGQKHTHTVTSSNLTLALNSLPTTKNTCAYSTHLSTPPATDNVYAPNAGFLICFMIVSAKTTILTSRSSNQISFLHLQPISKLLLMEPLAQGCPTMLNGFTHWQLTQNSCSFSNRQPLAYQCWDSMRHQLKFPLGTTSFTDCSGGWLIDIPQTHISH